MQIPILMYHSIVSDYSKARRDGIIYPYSLLKDDFVRHLEFLKENKFQTIGLNEILNKKAKDTNKNVIITFDDGYVDNYNYALPCLKKFGFKATFFVATAWIGKPGCLSWDNLEEMASAGMEIGSHTANHLPLAELAPQEIKFELESSKETINQQLGINIYSLSFPHGSYNKQTVEIAASLDFKICCTSNWGYFSEKSSLMECERFSIKKNISLTQFARLINNEKLYFLKTKLLKGGKRQVEDAIGLNNYNKLAKAYCKLKGKT
jgi:peptidoglycan/xylan/chitin deacetylase (PgdA/CDA1 family)